MLNNGLYIMWSHIAQMSYGDADNGLKLLPKITSDHINLTPYSAMRVNHSVQVLSASMAAVFKRLGPPEAAATATFCEMVNTVF